MACNGSYFSPMSLPITQDGMGRDGQMGRPGRPVGSGTNPSIACQPLRSCQSGQAGLSIEEVAERSSQLPISSSVPPQPAAIAHRPVVPPRSCQSGCAWHGIVRVGTVLCVPCRTSQLDRGRNPSTARLVVSCLGRANSHVLRVSSAGTIHLATSRDEFSCTYVCRSQVPATHWCPADCQPKALMKTKIYHNKL